MPITAHSEYQVARDRVNYLLAGTDLDVDSDNDLVIDPGENADGSGEDFFENHPPDQAPEGYKWGMIVPVNDDDDDQNGVPDNGGSDAETIQDEADWLDLMLMALRGLNLDRESQAYLAGLGARLEIRKVSGEGVVRVFRTEPGDPPCLGVLAEVGDAVHSQGSEEFFDRLAAGTGTLTLAVEGVTPGDLVLESRLVLATGVVVHKDQVRVTVMKADLCICNGGNMGEVGDPVPDELEETEGAYLLVNWDNDNNSGVMNADGTWETLPVPDYNKQNVENEDDLAKLTPQIKPSIPNTGLVELSVSGQDSGKIKIWTKRTKEVEVELTDNKKVWDISNPTESNDFQNFMTNSYWIEGRETSAVQRGIEFTLKYYKSSGVEISKDVCKATSVMINLANAVYRDNEIPTKTTRGHGALIWQYGGKCTRAELNNDQKYFLIEMAGPTNTRNLTTITTSPGYPCYGCFTNLDITFVQRLCILETAKALIARAPINYSPVDAVMSSNPGFGDWDGKLNTITALRCDGLIEVCYEINGVDVWGMQRVPDNNIVHYCISDQTDSWTYHPIWGTWDHCLNLIRDNLEEHNDYDNGDFSKTLQPSTQCGHVVPVRASTQFQKQDLCLPSGVGSKGGN